MVGNKWEGTYGDFWGEDGVLYFDLIVNMGVNFVKILCAVHL